MYGYYIAMDDKLVQQYTENEIALKDLSLKDYSGLDIDRSWEAIHYLLCGDIADGKPPFSYVVPITSGVRVDYGSFGASLLRADQAAEALLAISELDEKLLRLKYDFKTMLKEEVYPLDPDINSDEDEDELFAFMLQYFNEIRRFYSQAVAEGKGILFYIF